MVAVRRVPRQAQASCGELTTRRIQQARYPRIAEGGRRQAVARLWMPKVRIARFRLVHDAFVPTEIARVRSDRCTIQEVDVPPQLIMLAVIRIVASDNHELQWMAGRWRSANASQTADHRLGYVSSQHLLRAVRSRHIRETGVRVEELETCWRLRIDHVNVRHLSK